jgi:lipopolysaccharide biosynthesis glycosyltransferase
MSLTTEAAHPVEVLFCCNTAFYQHLAVAIVSLLENNKRHHFQIYLITSDIDDSCTQKLMASLRRYPNYRLVVHRFDITKYNDFFVDGHVSAETYLRIFCAKVLDPSIDKILYLDSDIVVVGDIADLWRTDLKDNALGGVRDPFCQAGREDLGIPAGQFYVNAGVLLINLKVWREQNICEKLVVFIRQKGSELVFWDQDAINAVLFGSVVILPDKWNYYAWMCKRYWNVRVQSIEKTRPRSADIAIVHFMTKDKPWLFDTVVPKKRLYYHYLSKTEWRDYKRFDENWSRVPHYIIKLLLYHLGFDYRSVLRWVGR